MIEFKGKISGKTEKYFWRVSSLFVLRLVYAVLSIFVPVVVLLSVKMKSFVPVILYLVLFIVVGLTAFIPKSAKEKEKLLPRRVYIDGEYIFSESNIAHLSQSLPDVKRVYDFGEFYFFVFPFGRISNDFICQKDLLSCGTLEEFEALIEDKLIRKNAVK